MMISSIAHKIMKSSFCLRNCYAFANYTNIKIESKGNVALITLYRPKALNALCDALFYELNAATAEIDKDSQHGAIVLTGSEKAFAAGADIKEMKDQSFPGVYTTKMLSHWEQLTNVKKPIIAAVNGFALGGGLELALLCDIVLAGENAKFGLPEITLATIPGCGGTQRLIRAIGKSRAMEYILTGKFMNAQEAFQFGLVSRVYQVDKLVEEAVSLGQKISSFSWPVVSMAKEAINAAENLSLKEGLHFEKKVFYSTFALKDRSEGMSAFVEKRKPIWKNE